MSNLHRVVEHFWHNALDNTDLNHPIVILGETYDPVIRQEETQQPERVTTRADSSITGIRQYIQGFSFGREKEQIQWPVEFLDDVYSRLWLTYRTRFPPLARDEDGPSPLSLHNLIRGQNYDLNGDHFTTDCGWGCMIRTGQTMLANALIHLHLGREWRFRADADDKHDEIVSWFQDTPNRPFSIHNIVDQGRILSGKKAGEWFGPSAAARSIQALCAGFEAGLHVYIGSDSGDIYEQDLFKVTIDDNETFKPTLVLLGVRLGIDNVNAIYWDSLKDILSSSESVGIAGGRPSSSHYFFGYQGDYLFYLDPHIPQAALVETQENGSVSPPRLDTSTVHTNKIRKIHMSEIDPSMLLGFLIKTKEEWDSWKSKIQNPEHKNKIVHISPDENPASLSNRKPSFVVYDENGDDFVDVGLEYDEILEQDEKEDEVPYEDPVVVSSQPVLHESACEEPVIISSQQQVSRNESSGYVECSGSIKSDYENIDTTTEIFDDATAVEVVSIKPEQLEEPVIVGRLRPDVPHAPEGPVLIANTDEAVDGWVEERKIE